ncbi:GIY-YIG nuclease family protein [Sphingomonas sanguinis]|uniref:Uncharacterized protein n=1 Tax=Sphingomonas sanguinis TaxID=33051 RepID=A0A147J097_9SPHN|nr:GIY-YIG nuclease family protein [Sphingomonas sanguinis]KTW01302.1 hypothetical protein SB4_06120 [Sphingomonas sanguinis]
MSAVDTKPSWLEDRRDPVTQLPTTLYPFGIHHELIAGEQTGRWQLDLKDKMGLPIKAVSTHPDIWSAFRAMTDAYQEWFASRPVDRVYFIGSELKTGALVKIGHSVYPEARLRSLQTGNHERLQIFAMAPGGREQEAKYHSRWRARRPSGEWFMLGDCIINEIHRLQEQAA